MSARAGAGLAPWLAPAGAAVALLGLGGWWLWPAAGPDRSAPGAEAGARADSLPVPSGQPVQFLDQSEEEGGVLRVRFLAPQIGADSAGDQASEDMQALCDGFVLPRLPDPANPPRQIVISLSERAVPLGETAPDVVQFFEAYRVESGACVWEMF